MVEPENNNNCRQRQQIEEDDQLITMEVEQQTGAKPDDRRYNVDDVESKNNKNSSSCCNYSAVERGNNDIKPISCSTIGVGCGEQSGIVTQECLIRVVGGSSPKKVEGINVENDKKERQKERQKEEEKVAPADKEGQMRSCCIESPQPQLFAQPAQLFLQPSEAVEPSSSARPPEGLGKSGSCRLSVDSGKNKNTNNNWGGRLSASADLNYQPIKLSTTERRLVGGGGGDDSEGGDRCNVEQRELEVEWSLSASLFKRAARFSGGSRSLCVRTGLVKTIKSGNSSNSKLQKESIGRTIKSFVENFRFNSMNNDKLENRKLDDEEDGDGDDEENNNNSSSSSSSSGSELSCANDSQCLMNSRETKGGEYEPTVKKCSATEPLKQIYSAQFSGGSNINTNDCISTSYSCQSMLNNPTVNKAAIIGGKKESEELETIARSGDNIKEVAYSSITATDANSNNKLIMVDHRSSSNITNSSPIINSLASGGGGSNLAKNKYVIEDKLRKQKQQQQQDEPQTTKVASGQTRMENRRSTHCSSIGAMTSDMNYDSSLSSVNNCSGSNNTCTTTNRQCSGENIDGTGAGDDGGGYNRNSCSKKPPNSNQCNITMNKNPHEGQQSAKKRENWDKNIEFLLAVIGFAVDLGNVWRFPYICYMNGGGAFLIPYTVMFILGGLPIFYLEMSLGQYFSSGCLTVWKRVCPMAKGIGYAMCVLNFFTGLYYNTIISWAVFFFVESFTSVLPWTSCNNSWNSDDCKTIEQRQTLKSNFSSLLPDGSGINQTQLVHFSSPTKDYFEREVLQVHLSHGIDDLGYVRKPLAIYLALVFICIYFAIWKGVKSTGKAVWITALLPYFVLIPLLIRGVFLEGAWLGIKYYLSPQWVKIIQVDVWVEAAKQIYFSLGPGFGTLMALSSYNKFNHNCRRDALIAASVNYFASFISGLVIFAVLGYMATIENVNINDVATEGPGLVFQVYPEGLATMRFSSMWSVLFFIMVITLGIDSTFGGLESVITGLCDEYPRVLRAHRGIFIGFLIILIYLCSLPTTTYGGNYVIYVLESYGTSLSLLFIVLVETIIVCWLYGADRFCKNLEEMYGETPGAYWRICWKYISPTILLLIFIAACGQELNKYHILTNGTYTYPHWAPTVGLLMTGSSVCCIPIYAIYYLKTKTTGSFLERLKIASRPIEGDHKGDKEIYVDALTDKIRDDIDVHLDTVI